MANPPFRSFPQPPNPYTNPASLPNWMRRISEAGWEAERRKREAREHLSPVVRKSNPSLTPIQQQVLKRQLSSFQKKEVILSAEGARRLQATLRSAREAVARAGISTNRQTIRNLHGWETFLDQALSAP
jgi:hypothetical protein